MRCTGVILAGGDAARFDGQPKGLERVGGARIIDRVALALAGASDALLLVANDPLADGWLPGVRTEPDVRPGAGALGGIHAALVRAGTPVLVVAWDMPFVAGDLLRTLRSLGEAGADVARAGGRLAPRRGAALRVLFAGVHRADRAGARARRPAYCLLLRGRAGRDAAAGRRWRAAATRRGSS